MMKDKNTSETNSDTDVHMCPRCSSPLHPMADNILKCMDCTYEEPIPTVEPNITSD